MDGFSLVLAVCRVASLAIAAAVIGLAFSQVTQSWRDDATVETLAPPPAPVPTPVPIVVEGLGPAEAERDAAAAGPMAAERRGAASDLEPARERPEPAVTVGPASQISVLPEGPSIAVERLGPPPPLADDLDDGLLAPMERIESTLTAPQSPAERRTRRTASGARPSATGSAWWPNWLRWPAHGSSAGIPPVRDAGGGEGARR